MTEKNSNDEKIVNKIQVLIAEVRDVKGALESKKSLSLAWSSIGLSAAGVVISLQGLGAPPADPPILVSEYQKSMEQSLNNLGESVSRLEELRKELKELRGEEERDDELSCPVSFLSLIDYPKDDETFKDLVEMFDDLEHLAEQLPDMSELKFNGDADRYYTYMTAAGLEAALYPEDDLATKEIFNEAVMFANYPALSLLLGVQFPDLWGKGMSRWEKREKPKKPPKRPA